MSFYHSMKIVQLKMPSTNSAMEYIVFTDLDGTLLDHKTYRFDAALQEVKRLQQKGIPIIPVTSKTKAELNALRKALNLDGPFVVENGSAVFLPDSASDNLDLSDCEQDGHYSIKAFSEDKFFWTSVIESLSEMLPSSFKSFSQMTVDEIVDLTGLAHESAELAANRQYSDPIHWYGSEQDLLELESFCERLSITVVKGGRFVHLIKGANKGLAVQWLTQKYKQRFPNIKGIALGDGENDVSMLACVDFPVQIKSESHDFPNFSSESLMRTSKVGPAGWAEAIQSIIKE